MILAHSRIYCACDFTICHCDGGDRIATLSQRVHQPNKKTLRATQALPADHMQTAWRMGRIGQCAHLKGQYQPGCRFANHATKIVLDTRQRVDIIGLKAQHNHRRGIRRPREAKAIGVFDA